MRHGCRRIGAAMKAGHPMGRREVHASCSAVSSTIRGGSWVKSLYRIQVGRTRTWVMPGQGETLSAVRVREEVALPYAGEFLTGGDVRGALNLYRDLVVPADHERDPRVGAQVAVLARRVEGVEHDLEFVADCESDDRRLWCSVWRDGCLHSEPVPAEDSNQRVALHVPSLTTNVTGKRHRQHPAAQPTDSA